MNDGSNDIRNYYDDNGNPVKEVEGNSATATTGQKKTYTYDDFNRLTRTLTGTTTNLNSNSGLKYYYTYDIMGNVITEGSSTSSFLAKSYSYDILGRKISGIQENFPLVF